MSTFTRIAVIYNPNSTGDGQKLATELRDQLADSGTPIELIETKYAGHATELANEIARSSSRPLIISSSGDGGYNEVINGALNAQSAGAKPVCAVLPAGNANDHSHALSDKPLVELIEAEAIQPIDVIKVSVRTGSDEAIRYAHSYVGLGLTPTVAVELNRNRLNRMKETYIVVKALRALQPVEIVANGKTLRIDSLVISNINRMAKVLTMADEAQPDDGTLRVTIIHNRSHFTLLRALVKAMVRGLHGFEATHYAFIAKKDMTMQTDGEVLNLKSDDEVHISVLAGALNTLR